MLGAGRDAETLPVPTLFAKLEVARRVEARQRHNAFMERAAAARGTTEHVQKISDVLTRASGVEPAMGDVEDLMRALGGG
jgi:hypothetical protein